MIFRIGNIFTDGKTAIRVANGFADWHSEMPISDLEGIAVPLPDCVAKDRERTQERRLSYKPPLAGVPVDLSWIPKRRFSHRGPRVPTKRELR